MTTCSDLDIVWEEQAWPSNLQTSLEPEWRKAAEIKARERERGGVRGEIRWRARTCQAAEPQLWVMKSNLQQALTRTGGVSTAPARLLFPAHCDSDDVGTSWWRLTSSRSSGLFQSIPPSHLDRCILRGWDGYQESDIWITKVVVVWLPWVSKIHFFFFFFLRSSRFWLLIKMKSAIVDALIKFTSHDPLSDYHSRDFHSYLHQTLHPILIFLVDCFDD